MPLPDPEPVIVQAPARAGVGLRFNYHNRVAMPGWPEDWWQRNYDSVYVFDEPGPLPLTDRQMHLPPPPPVTP